MEIGQCVDFVDPTGRAHEALVTQVWDGGDKRNETPSINVVFVTDDSTKDDQYGRQIERQTSVVHANNQAAHGMYWREVA